MKLSTLAVLAMGTNFAHADREKWFVTAYTDNTCGKETGSWGDSQPGCTDFDGLPDILSIQTDTVGLNSRCGWSIASFEENGCTGFPRTLDLNGMCQSVTPLTDFDKPIKSFSVIENPGC